MKAEELDYRHRIVGQYNQKLMAEHENFSEGSYAFSVVIFIAAGLAVFYGIIDKNTLYVGAGISLAFTGLTFVFITAILRLLGQIKELNKIILFKMGDHIEKEETL